ncbi:aldehyde dehydrogenase family protein [Variovorax sp. Varisp36]|uniref:aldehyde dehydrogenase family protein n=1 Tax=Variovorax sp. Varisp36 TaxID=3243031 RepID=UPI0039A62E13
MKRNFIAGEWVKGDDCAENINPSDTRDVIGAYARASRFQATEAISAAHAAAPQWAESTPQQRAEVLDKVGSEILARHSELADLLAREEGKTLADARGEVLRAAQIFKFFAGEALRIHGGLAGSVRAGISVEVAREPVGVVSIITPWNFPIAIPAWKIAPALAHGNAVVFKPADLVPASAWALAEILSRTDLPAGCFNLVMGRGREIGDVLLEDSRISAVTFTGSEVTGRRIAAACVSRKGPMAKFQLEMGGKNPLVVLDDADLDLAVDCAINGAFFATGQRCTASSRLVVTKGIHDRFVAAMVARMSALRVGDARKPGTIIGPVVDAAQLREDLDYVDIGRREGAMLTGGHFREQIDGKSGFYLEPALFVATTNDMTINREEVFGPVAAVIQVADAEEALAVANDTEFGLSAGVCTTSLKMASLFKRKLEAGMVMVNAPTAGVDPHVPFGGRKASSYGPREQGPHAAEFYTTVKTAYVQP